MKTESQATAGPFTLMVGDQIVTLSDPLAHAEREGWPVLEVPTRAEALPPELAKLKDSDGAMLIYGDGSPSYCTADLARSIFQAIINRTANGHYSCSELALVLSEQAGQKVGFFEDAVKSGYARGLLRFWFPDGSPAECPPPHPDDAMGGEDYLGFSGEYTTVEAANDWLEQWGAQYRLEPYKAITHGKKLPQQIDLILQTLRDMGHDPYNLPTRPRGKRGPKAEVKDKLRNHSLFSAKSAFDQAWKDAGLNSKAK